MLYLEHYVFGVDISHEILRNLMYVYGIISYFDIASLV